MSVEQAHHWVNKVVPALDGGADIAGVYGRWMVPAEGRTKAQDIESLSTLFGRADAVQKYVGDRGSGPQQDVTRINKGNTFTFTIREWTVTPKYPFDQRWRFHENAVYDRLVRVTLFATGPAEDQVLGHLPIVDTLGSGIRGTHDAPQFHFTDKGGYYYDDADGAPRNPHPDKLDALGTGICWWVPPEGRGTDGGLNSDLLMVKTYVGWVHYNELQFFDKSWPEDFHECASAE